MITTNETSMLQIVSKHKNSFHRIKLKYLIIIFLILREIVRSDFNYMIMNFFNLYNQFLFYGTLHVPICNENKCIKFLLEILLIDYYFHDLTIFILYILLFFFQIKIQISNNYLL